MQQWRFSDGTQPHIMFHPPHTNAHIAYMESSKRSPHGVQLAVMIQVTHMLLEQRRREADELERQWLHVKSQCVSLAEELQGYVNQHRQSTSVSTAQNQITIPRRQTSLLDLPNELICEVFEYSTYLCHPSIRSLLLVCKRFHQLIMGTSSLWTRVDIIFPEDLLGCFYPTKSYVAACLERSRGHLLDVTIKYPRRMSSTEYTLDSVVKNITPLIGEWEAEGVRGTLEEAHWECESSPVQERVTHIDHVIQSLAGTHGEQISRWGSLSITLPEEKWWSGPLFQMTEYPASNLKRLEISNIFYMDDLLHEHGFSLREMLCLRSLEMDRLSLHWFNPLPTSITHLDTMYEYGEIFRHLSALQRLRYLCIRGASGYIRMGSNNPIILLNLSEIHIHGHIDRVLELLIAPHLKILRVSSRQTSIMRPLPFVPTIEWTYDRTVELEKPDPFQYNALSSILGNVTRTDCVSIRGFPLEIVDEITNRLKRTGEISTNLKRVEVLTDNARIVVCDWTL